MVDKDTYARAMKLLGQPGAKLVLTYNRSTVSGRLFVISPKGGLISDQLAQTIISEPRRKTKRRRRDHWQNGRERRAPHDIATSAQAIRAELLGSNAAIALGAHVEAYAPILELCRRLVARGIDPVTPLEAWRGPTLCLRVRNIGAAAALEVRPSGIGRPVFVRRKTVRAVLEVV